VSGRHIWLIGALAAVGLALALAATSWWVPEAQVRIADRAETERSAAADAEALGYRVDRVRKPDLVIGPRFYSTSADVAALREQVDEPEVRRRLLAAAPPLRLGVRFWDVVGPDGEPGALLLEYDEQVRLVGASFGWDGIVQAGQQPYAGKEFADQIASRLLGQPAPEPETLKLGGGDEYIYRPDPARPGRDRHPQPGAYVYLGGSARWIAHRQPAPYAVLTRQFTFFQNSFWAQFVAYVLVAVSLLALSDLLWRLTRRRAGFGHAWLLSALLILGLLPTLAHLPSGLQLFNFSLGYLLSLTGILLAWAAAEAELRDVRPGSIEHWDRLVFRHPLAGTGRDLVLGVLFGVGLAGALAASGRISELAGGGYERLVVILPEYWLLSTPWNWGLLLTAATAFLMSFGRRVAGRPGAIAGAAVSGLTWSLVVPAGPQIICLAIGVLIALAAGWLMSRFGLLALAAASVTALSLPTALILAPHFPLRWESLLAALLPLPVLVLGLVLWRRAPEHGALESVTPSYVSQLERQARLKGEVEALREFQLSLLPRLAAGSELSQADIAWRMVPADTVGGDFLDLIEDESGRLWIAVADAAGHGISCSVLTAFTKAAVTEHVGAETGPAEALRRIRRLFRRLHTSRTMVTLLVAVWDPQARRLKVANAGHPPLLIWDGREVRELGHPSSPLGTTLRGGGDHEEAVELPTGAVVVGYSDGAPEATSPSGETYGYEAWPAKLKEIAPEGLDASRILEELLAGVARHRAGQRAEDDLTVVVLRLA
jgi:hypothetical protein